MKKVLCALLAVTMIALCLPFTAGVSAAAAELPSSVDLTGTVHLPPIADQGSLGSCVSMAVTHMQFTNAYSRYIHSIDPDTDWNPSSGDARYVFSPRFTFNLGGAGTAWVYDILTEQGTVPQTYSAFNGGVTGAINASNPLTYDWATIDGYWQVAQNYRLKTYDQVWTIHRETVNGVDYDRFYEGTESGEGLALINRIKESLNAGNVVVTGGYPYRWTTDLVTISGKGTLGKTGDRAIPYSTGTAAGGHQVSIVGYDDNITCVKNGVTLKGAFKIANSWGTGWLNGGCVWMMYDAFNGKDQSKYSALNVSNRTWTMDQVIFVDWRTDMLIETPELTASVKLTTADRDNFSLTLVRIDPLTGKTDRHTPIMFDHAYTRPNYNQGYGFYGKKNDAAKAGEVTVNFDYFTKNLPAGKTVDDYLWGVEISYVETDSGKTASVNAVRFHRNGEEYYSRVGLDDAITEGSPRVYCAGRMPIVLDAVPGVTVTPFSGSMTAVPGQTFRFSVSTSADYKVENALNVYFNGEKLVADQGVYSFTAADGDAFSANVIKVEGVQKRSTKVIDLGNYGNDFEDHTGVYWMLMSVNNDDVDEDAVDLSAIDRGTYKYTIRCTVNGVAYDFKPDSYYDFGDSTLFRINVADQGWFPTVNNVYNMKVEFCLCGIPIYVDNVFSVNCRLTPHSEKQSAHTHDFSGEVIPVITPTCVKTGTGYKCCTESGCTARVSSTLPVDGTTHRFSSVVTVSKNATLHTPGELCATCIDCKEKVFAGYFTAQNGDTDGDNALTINDVTLMLDVLARRNDPEAMACEADLNGDGFFTIKDLTWLLLTLNG